MNMLKNCILLAALCVPGFFQPVWAETPPGTTFQELSCNELYVLASQIEPGTQRRRSPLFNEKTRVIAVGIGSVITYGYYYLGFSTAKDYFEDYRAHQRLEDLDKVRQHMAAKYCFQKS